MSEKKRQATKKASKSKTTSKTKKAASTKKAVKTTKAAGAKKSAKSRSAASAKTTVTKPASKKKSGPVRIEFADEEGRTESLRAAHVGEGLYRLEESPCFAYSVSLGDVVRAGGRGALRFTEVSEKSGNRTVRLLFTRFSAESEAAQSVLEGIEQLGCAFEHTHPTVLSINVPRGVSLSNVVEYLKSLRMWWEHADPTREALAE